LIVDEAQDVMNYEELAELDRLLIGGLQSGRWRIFLDGNNQSAVDGVFDHDALAQLTRWGATASLTVNCRNTGNVIAQVQSIIGADIGTPLGGAGPQVRFVKNPSRSLAEASESIDAELERLVEEGVELRNIAIITLCDIPSESAASATVAFRTGKIRSNYNAENSSAWLATAQSIKGLETQFGLVVDVDEIDDRASIAKLYVAMTRARIGLWIQYSTRGAKSLTELLQRGL
jgi:hypothetical protein